MPSSLLAALPGILTAAREEAEQAKAAAAPLTDAEGTILHGDNLQALAGLLAGGAAGTVDLIYIDPPFDSRAEYAATITVHLSDGRTVDITRPAYKDSWAHGGIGKLSAADASTAAYLAMLAPRLILMRELLTESGSIMVHLDWHVGHYVRVLLDEIFGRECFINELVWRYGKMSRTTRRFPQNHDTIYFYARDPHRYYFQPVKGAESEYKKRYARRLRGDKLYWGDVKESTDRLIAGRARKRVKELGRELVDDDVLFDFASEFKVQDDVFYDISIIKGNAAERLGYDTQKPEKLLARLLEAACPPGGLVADFFGGSGTTAAVAQRTGRRFITGDVGAAAVSVMRARLGAPVRALVGTVEAQVFDAQVRALNGCLALVDFAYRDVIAVAATLGLDEENARKLAEIHEAEPLALAAGWTVSAADGAEIYSGPVAPVEGPGAQVEVSDVFGHRATIYL